MKIIIAIASVVTTASAVYDHKTLCKATEQLIKCFQPIADLAGDPSCFAFSGTLPLSSPSLRSLDVPHLRVISMTFVSTTTQTSLE
jgi:hypothetical protein